MIPLIETIDLVKYFSLGRAFTRNRKFVKAVDGISLKIYKGENVALVGESGSGKTTLGRLIMSFIKPTSGRILFNEIDIDKLNLKDFRRKAQMIFQDPTASLNPRKTVRQLLIQPFQIHKIIKGDELNDRIYKLLESVVLTPPEIFLKRYTHELSGGQRQRVVLARAIALNPGLIVSDEPVSALDVSIRAQILDLMKNIGKEIDSTYLYITHDLAIVRSICSKVFVMYLGKIVEMAETENLFKYPSHPYTKILISATPIPDPYIAQNRKRILLQGEIPSPINIPSGCRFKTRCPKIHGKCQEDPPMIEIKKGHFVACHLY